MNHSTFSIEAFLQASKQAFYAISQLTAEQKHQALVCFAQVIEDQTAYLLAENQKDLEAQASQLSPSLYQRLKLDHGKLQQMVQGIRDVANLPDPIGKLLAKTQLDEGLILEKVTVPLGVIAIIFESRPDVIPQVLSLILKSGNAVILKGGKEAAYSNRAFMKLVEQVQHQLPFLPPHWAQFVDSREAVHALLDYPQYVDLVIPRGSNALVQSIMAATKIPVLGHADGICHLYVHPSANLQEALPLIIDAKAQYPAACNALETLLVDAKIAEAFFAQFSGEATKTQLVLKGCPITQHYLPDIPLATEEDWRTEYGDLTLSIRVVQGLQEAISHINTYGSHHTDGILATQQDAIEIFLASVDSASVFANASTRFADGFRFGFGAEIGISTARTHARGPVGLEGLITYKYKLRGAGHVVADYTGSKPRPFQHKPLI